MSKEYEPKIVLRCLYKEKLHPHELTFMQEEIKYDSNHRMNFCERMMNDEFFDEPTVTELGGKLTKRQTHMQYPQKVKVWQVS